MKAAEFFTALMDISREKDVDYEVLLEAIRQGLLAAYKKAYKLSSNVEIILDDKEKKIDILAIKTVVENVEDPQSELSIAEAKRYKKEATEGDVLKFEVTPSDFGRFAAITCKQIVTQRIKEAEKEKVLREFTSKEHDMVFGEVSRISGDNVYFNLGKAEGVLPRAEQIPGEVYSSGRKFHCYILKVDRASKEPMVVISRTHPQLLVKLMELEIPEISQGIIEIRGVVRDPGVRAKVAVASNQQKVDPVGSCIGTKGVRINVISDELKGERIDVLKWYEDPRQFIASALSPAKVYSVQIIEDENRAIVKVEQDQFSLAIGKKGSNVRLASRLAGFKVDMKVLED